MRDTNAERAWEFSDDRGHRATGPRVPRRVVAYVRAGAALWEYGIRPVAVYGSAHDNGVAPDPAKSGELDPDRVPYLGGGAAVAVETLRGLRPDVIVDVTYDGKGPYALPEPLAEAVGAPVVALGVGGDASLRQILRRFAELAASLGAGTEGAGRELAEAEQELRDAAAAGPGISGVALSAAGPDQVHLARPGTWPELHHLADLGLHLPDPGPGPGVNWLTTDWRHALGRLPRPRPGPRRLPHPRHPAVDPRRPPHVAGPHRVRGRPALEPRTPAVPARLRPLPAYRHHRAAGGHLSPSVISATRPPDAPSPTVNAR